MPIAGHARKVSHPEVLKSAARVELCNKKGVACVLAENHKNSRPPLYNWMNRLLDREEFALLPTNVWAASILGSFNRFYRRISNRDDSQHNQPHFRVLQWLAR
jgi:hypothetical protein